MKSKPVFAVLLLLGFAGCSFQSFTDTDKPPNPRANWKTITLKGLSASCGVDQGRFLWLGGPNGLYRVDKTDSSIAAVKPSEYGNASDTILDLAPDGDSALWLVLPSGPAHYSDQGNRWKQLPKPRYTGTYDQVKVYSHPKGGVWLLARQVDFRTWAGRGLFRFDGTNWLQMDDRAISFAFDTSGNPWVLSGGLKTFASGAWVAKPTVLPRYVDYVDNLTITADGKMYSTASVDNSFSYVLEYLGDSAKHAFSPPARPNGTFVHQLIVADSALWVLHNSGLSRIRATDTLLYDYGGLTIPQKKGGGIWLFATFSVLGLHDAIDDTLPLGSLPGQLTALEMDFQGGIWAGMPRGLARLERGRWRTMDVPAMDDRDPGVEILSIGPDGSICITSLQGVHRWDGSEWILIPFPDPIEEGWPINYYWVEDLQTDRDGALWLGSGHGLFKWDGDNWKIMEGFAKVPIRSLALDSAGGIWAAGDSVLFRILDGKMQSFPVATGSVHVGEFLRIAVDRFNHVWATFSDRKTGLWRFDGKTWTRFTSGNSGLHADDVGPLAANPSSGVIWVGNENAISAYDQDAVSR